LQASRSAGIRVARCGQAPSLDRCNEGDTGCLIATPPLEAVQPDAASRIDDAPATSGASSANDRL